MRMLKTAVSLQVMQDVCPTGGNYMSVSSYSVTPWDSSFCIDHVNVIVSTSAHNDEQCLMATSPKDTLKAFCLNTKAYLQYGSCGSGSVPNCFIAGSIPVTSDSAQT